MPFTLLFPERAFTATVSAATRYSLPTWTDCIIVYSAPTARERSVAGENCRPYSTPLQSRTTFKTQPHLKENGHGIGGHEPIEGWTAKRRETLVLRILKGETSLAEAARQHGLTVAEVDGWHEQFLRGAEISLWRPRRSADFYSYHSPATIRISSSKSAWSHIRPKRARAQIQANLLFTSNASRFSPGGNLQEL